MQNISRRQLLAAAPALTASAAAVPGIDRSLIARHDESVERYLKQQVTDPASRFCGGLPDPTGLHHPGSAGGLLTACATAILQPASRHHRSSLLFERARLAARYLERSQSPDGNISLLVTNFNSPPDTGFVVHGVAAAACLAQRAGNRELLGLMETFLQRAGAGMARGGVHTPNHRWVVCSALAQIHEVFPNPAYLRRIDQWLAEGIDIDADGQYTERSTGVYNTVCDRAFTVLAAKLKRPELLDPVRRNLDSMLYLVHAGYEVVTEISRRQDQYDRKDMSGYWFPLQYLALRDGNGRYGAIARHFAPVAASLTTLMEYPELQAEAPTAPVPDNYEKVFPELKVARIRRGAASATLVLENDSHFFSFRRGDAVIQSVRFASAFFGRGQFIPTTGGKKGNAYEMSHSIEGPYYQPLDPPAKVKAGEWRSTVPRRARTEVCKLTQSVSIEETRTGFKLRLRAEGTSDVPLAVEIALREGGKLEGCEAVPDGHVLAGKQAVYRVGNDVVKFGPGRKEHTYTSVRGAQPAAPGVRVYLCGLTPFDHTLEIG